MPAAGPSEPAVSGQDMVAALVSMSLQTYSQVRGMAQATLAAVLKRHPSLAPGVLPTYLGVLSGQPSPGPAEAWQDSEAALQRCVDSAVPAMARGSRQQQDISPAGEARVLAERASQAAEHTLRSVVVRAGAVQRVLGLQGCPAGTERSVAACARRPGRLLQQAAAPCTARHHVWQLSRTSTESGVQALNTATCPRCILVCRGRSGHSAAGGRVPGAEQHAAVPPGVPQLHRPGRPHGSHHGLPFGGPGQPPGARYHLPPLRPAGHEVHPPARPAVPSGGLPALPRVRACGAYGSC